MMIRMLFRCAVYIVLLGAMGWGGTSVVAPASAEIEVIDAEPQLYVIVMGDNKPKALPGLGGPEADAQAMAAFFRKQSNLAEDGLKVLLHENLVREKVIGTLVEVARRSKPKDLVVIYHSGYINFDAKTGRGGLVMNDAKLNRNGSVVADNKTGLFSRDDLLASLERFSNRRFLFVTDSSLSPSFFDNIPPDREWLALLASDEQEAVEREFDGQARGVFTYVLERAFYGDGFAKPKKEITPLQAFDGALALIGKHSSQRPIWCGQVQSPMKTWAFKVPPREAGVEPRQADSAVEAAVDDEGASDDKD